MKHYFICKLSFTYFVSPKYTYVQNPRNSIDKKCILVLDLNTFFQFLLLSFQGYN